MDADLTDADRRILRVLAEVEEDAVAPSAQEVAQRANAQPTPVREIINKLHEAGYVDASLKLTDEGRSAVGA